MKSRLVVLDSSVAVTGGFKCAVRMARLLEPVAEVTLVLPADSRISGSELEHFNRVERMQIARLRRSAGAAAAYVPALVRAGWRLNRVLRRERAHALIVNDFFVAEGILARLLGYRGKLLTWVRIDPAYFPRALSSFWLGAARRGSDEIVTVSRFMCGRLPPGLGARLVYDCIDLDLPVGRCGTAPRSDVVMIGNYIRGKGHDVAIDAFRLIAEDYPEARLLFHGSDMGLAKNRAYRAELERRAADGGLAGRIVFEGFADDLAPVYERAAMALNLSQCESFSLTCLEASQCGVPVVAFRSGGPAEIVEHGVTGYLCEVGDIAGVVQAMRALLADRSNAESMGEAASRHVASRFGTAQYVEALRALLDL